MMLNFSCRKFARLSHETRDRALTSQESAFLDRHGQDCARCRELTQQGEAALAELRGIALDAAPSESFDEKVLQAFAQPRRLGFGYWSPAVMGAAIAGIAVLCALTIVTKTAESPVRREPIGAAMRFNPSRTSLPPLNLTTSTPLPR